VVVKNWSRLCHPFWFYLLKCMAKQRITISYGNQIELTTLGKKSKKVFVKFSPAFREKQLKELKGAPLSVFLCYALHSNEYGYCWIDNKQVVKETGYSESQIMNAKQKLREKGYLYDARLYEPKTKRFRDWIYRIFQPVENDKEFEIRGIKLKSRTTNFAEFGKTPSSEKLGGIIEEEPTFSNNKEEPSIVVGENADNWDFSEKLKEILNDKKRHIRIIGLYWQFKGFNFENQEQYQAALKRELRAAKLLVGYSDERILQVMEFLRENTRIKWTLETVHKYIDEDLDSLIDDGEDLYIPEYAKGRLQ